MMSIENKYPLYRKYVGIDVWFKIVDAKEFIEIKKLGKQYLKHHVIAKQFPEIQFIKDMIDFFERRWEEISKTDFEEVEKKSDQ